jgi:tight adherence protein C
MSPVLSLIIGAVFVSVALAIWATASIVLDWGTLERRQIRKLAQGRSDLLTDLQLTDIPSPWVKRFQQAVPKSPKEMSAVRRRMTAAGYRTATAAVAYAMAELLLPVLFGGVALIYYGYSRWYFVIFAAAIGFAVPSVWLGRKTKLRQKDISNGLPDALDLMIVCIESGSSVDQAIVKTSDELDLSHPALAEELRLVTTEMRAGKPRLEAFKNFASRTKVDDVRSLVAMLNQTDRFGTSIAQALRTHAEVSRTKRRQAAEERAAKIGVKLVFPLVFCLLPALYIAILGPAIVQYETEFKPGISRK